MKLSLKTTTKTPDQHYEKGMASFIVTLIVLGIGLIIVLSIAFLVTSQQKITTNIYNSSQAYFTAEAGIEDAMLRIRKGMTVPSGSYNVPIDNEQAVVAIGDPIGGSRTIVSQGQKNDLWRKVQAVNTLSGDNVQFFFGAQVGAGGLTMGQTSEIQGNVFSNGSIIGISGGSKIITGDAIVAGNGNRIEGVTVQGNTQAHTCKNSSINGDLDYVSGGSIVNCTVGGNTNILSDEIEPESLPISDTQIASWKSDAENGGVYTEDYSLSGSQTAILGPLKIIGDLTLNNQAILALKGTVWVTGNINLNQSAVLKLDPASYGSASGVIIADGTVDISNSVTTQGTGQSGSFLMVLTTSPANPAMNLANSASAGVFYANNGFINISNNTLLREVTAFGLNLGQSVKIQYESGLANLFFTSGPGAGWKLVSWQEIP